MSRQWGGVHLYYPTGNAIYGSLILKDSILKNIPYMHLWYPQVDCYIERNIFLNTGGISVGHDDDIKVYIKNNVFYQQLGDPGTYYAVKNWASYDTSETIVEYNSFLSADRVALILPSGYTPSHMIAINNYWNTTDTGVIDSMIYDKNDDLGVADYIIYEPFLTEPHINTSVFIITDVKANGFDEIVTITTDDNLSITVSTDSSGYSGENADWWVVADTPFGWYHYDVLSGSWTPSLTVTFQGSLINLTPPFTVLSMSGLPPGIYTFYFGVDMVMNGSLDMSDIFYDSVVVNITTP